MLVDDGRLRHEETTGGWVAAGNLLDVHVPPTISALLSARLDRLTNLERAVVEAAAIEGKEFHRGAVAALLPEGAAARLDANLDSLVHKELVTRERSSLAGEDAYLFHHQLIRDAAYDGIPKARRATLHRSFADWLERAAGGRVVEQAAIVGYHLAQAHAYRAELGLPEDRDLRLRAAAVLGAAGSRALDAGDARAAIQLLRPATGIARGDRMEAATLLRLMRRSALDRPPSSSAVSPSVLAEAAAAADDVGYGIWDAKATSALMHEAVRAFREHGRHRVALEAISWVWCIELSLGRVGPMLEVASRGVHFGARAPRPTMDHPLPWLDDRRTRDRHDPVVRGPCAHDGAGGDVSERAGHRGCAATRPRDDRRLAGKRRGCPQARSDGPGDRSRARTPPPGLVPRPGRRLYRLGRGRPRAGGEALPRGESDACRARRPCRERPGRPALARARLALGRNQDAAEVVRGFSDAAYYPMARIAAPSVAAVIAARRGDIEGALRLSDEALAMADQTDCLIDQADVAIDRAEIFLLAGRSVESHVAAEDALARFEHKEYAIGIRRARAFLAALPA